MDAHVLCHIVLLGMTMAAVAGKVISVDRVPDIAEEEKQTINAEGEAENAGKCRESPSVNTDDAGNSRESPSVNTDDAGNNREPPSVNTDDAGNSRESPSVNTDDAGNSRESPSVNTDDAGNSRESPNVNTDDAGNSRESPSVDTDDAGNSQESPSVNTDDETQDDILRQADGTGKHQRVRGNMTMPKMPKLQKVREFIVQIPVNPNGSGPHTWRNVVAADLVPPTSDQKTRRSSGKRSRDCIGRVLQYEWMDGRWHPVMVDAKVDCVKA